MNPRRQEREAGFTLIEVLVAIWVVSLLLGLSAAALAEVARLRADQERYNQRLAAADHLLRRIARDVRPGRAFLPTAGEFTADCSTMIVSTGAVTVVYHADPRRTERIELRKDGMTRAVVLNAPGVRVSFDFEGAPVPLARSVIATAEWAERPAIGVSHPTLSLRVALRSR
jgi:prepilin-type N-terminal cleavage/methylation domain-containing protein